MNRRKLLNKAFQRGHLLNLNNKLYKNWISKFIIGEIKGDVGVKGDITSSALFNGNNKKIKAIVKSRSNGIVAGIEESVFLYNNNRIKVKQIKKDGQRIKKGDVLLRLEGKEKDLLRVERSASDLMERMSGIATLANDLIKKVRGKVGIAPTRKTQWRYLDKKAGYVGGGLTHRLALWESILIKDNHLRLLKVKNPVEYALEKAWSKKDKSNFIEIEVTNEKQAISAAKKFKELNKKGSIPCLIMFDNMEPLLIKKIIKKLKIKKSYNHVLLEASGGIIPSNIVSYAKSGVDVISLGYLTNSSKALNIKQQIL